MATGLARADGKNVQAAGAGKVALWGVQQADIVYESLLYRDEQKNAASTRLTLLFSDALLRGEAVECGPVRSLRDASASLREEWQGALAFGSPMGAAYLGDAVERLKADSAAAFDIVDIRRGGLGGRLQGVKAPSNLSVDVNACRPRGGGFHRPTLRLFSERRTQPPAGGAAPDRAAAFTLDWGDARYLARFVWDEAAGGYLREVAGWPFACYPNGGGAHGRGRSRHGAPGLCQRDCAMGCYDALRPRLQNPVLVGEGTADLFVGGRHVRGTWSRAASDTRTIYCDESGREVLLAPGKTWIALFPANAALIFE